MLQNKSEKSTRLLYSQNEECFRQDKSLEDILFEAWENGNSDIYTIYEAELVQKYDGEITLGYDELRNIKPRLFKQINECKGNIDFDINNFIEVV